MDHVDDIRDEEDAQVWTAEVFLYPAGDHITADTVAAWFRELGCTDISVSHVLYDEDDGVRDGRTLANERWLNVTFVAAAAVIGRDEALTRRN